MSPSPTHTHPHSPRSSFHPSSFLVLLLPSFRLFYKYACIHTYAREYVLPSCSFLHDHCRGAEYANVARYYVMPADRGSDILCMLMPHNVGFVPLFSIYLFGSLLRVRPPLLSHIVALVPRGPCLPNRLVRSREDRPE